MNGKPVDQKDVQTVVLEVVKRLNVPEPDNGNAAGRR